MDVYIESWQSLVNKICDLDTRVKDVIGYLLNSDQQNVRKVLICDYAYGDWVVEDGVPKLPGGMEFPKEYLINDALPFGIVKKNALEISEWAPSSEGKAVEIPRAILGPGKLVGLFELQSWLCENRMPRSDWRISAGSRLAQPVMRLDGSEFSNRVRKIYETYDLKAPSERSPTSWLTMFGGVCLTDKDLSGASRGNEWRATVAFLHPQLFRSLYEQVKSSEERCRWIDVLTALAWDAKLSETPMSSGSVYNHLVKVAHHWRGGADAALRLAELCSQILSGGRPCFQILRPDAAPCEIKRFEVLGPFSQINQMLKTCERGGGLAVPLALHANQIGFFPLEWSGVYQLKGSNPEKDLCEILRNAIAPHSKPPPQVAELIEGFHCRIHFRAPRSNGPAQALIGRDTMDVKQFYCIIDENAPSSGYPVQQTFFDKILYRFCGADESVR